MPPPLPARDCLAALATAPARRPWLRRWALSGPLDLGNKINSLLACARKMSVFLKRAFRRRRLWQGGDHGRPMDLRDIKRAQRRTARLKRAIEGCEPGHLRVAFPSLPPNVTALCRSRSRIGGAQSRIFQAPALTRKNKVSNSTVSRLFPRDRWVVGSCVALIAVLAWIWLWREWQAMGPDQSMPGMEMPSAAMASPSDSAAYLTSAFVMWFLMMVAMMLPSAAPMILLYSALARGAGPGARFWRRRRFSPRSISPFGAGSRRWRPWRNGCWCGRAPSLKSASR